MEPTAKIAVHKLALNIPAIAEHPAIRRSVHAKKNSTIGFI
jgi:hypothetical protein